MSQRRGNGKGTIRTYLSKSRHKSGGTVAVTHVPPFRWSRLQIVSAEAMQVSVPRLTCTAFAAPSLVCTITTAIDPAGVCSTNSCTELQMDVLDAVQAGAQ